MHRDEISRFLDELLIPGDFKDGCPNGLQVEGQARVERLVTGVTGCVELLEQARDRGAQGVLVHHGIIWDHARPIYRGGYKQRVKTLLAGDINLWAFHLPLDAHGTHGNNALLADLLGLEERIPFGEYQGQLIGIAGKGAQRDREHYFRIIKEQINPAATIFAEGPRMIERIGILSGGAQKEFAQAAEAGLDLYITGEISEYNLHTAREEGINFAAAGHHATERFGVRHMGELLAQRCGLEVEFIDVENPA